MTAHNPIENWRRNGKVACVIFKTWLPQLSVTSGYSIQVPDVQLFCRELGYSLDHWGKEDAYFIPPMVETLAKSKPSWLCSEH